MTKADYSDTVGLSDHCLYVVSTFPLFGVPSRKRDLPSQTCLCINYARTPSTSGVSHDLLTRICPSCGVRHTKRSMRMPTTRAICLKVVRCSRCPRYDVVDSRHSNSAQKGFWHCIYSMIVQITIAMLWNFSNVLEVFDHCSFKLS